MTLRIRATGYRCNCGGCSERLVIYLAKSGADHRARKQGWKRRFGLWYAPEHFVPQTKKSPKASRVCERCGGAPTVCKDGRLARHRCKDGLYFKESLVPKEST